MTRYLTDLTDVLAEHPSIQELKFLNFPTSNSATNRGPVKANTLLIYKPENSAYELNKRMLLDILARNASKIFQIFVYQAHLFFFFLTEMVQQLYLAGPYGDIISDTVAANESETLVISRQIFGHAKFSGTLHKIVQKE